MKLQLPGIAAGAAAIALFLFVGCSSTQNKPALTSAADQPAKTTAPREVRQAQSSTSLEDLQKGRSSATPKESPLKEVYFDFDDYQLKPQARDILKANADWLRSNPAVTVQIEGHCDERGTSEYNMALGAKRAQAASDYLVSLGIAADRLSTISYGAEVPVCREHNEACWQKNRRDRFVARAAKPGV